MIRSGFSRMAFLVLFGGLLLTGCGPTPTAVDPSGIDISRDPEQSKVPQMEPMTFEKGGWTWTYTPKAHYILRGIVLSRKNYGSDWNAAHSPCDVAMAWGKLVEDGLYEKITWSQSGRWYWWQYGGSFRKGNTFVARYSSNTHIVPANDNVEKAAKSLDRGDIAELEGDLIRIDGKKGGQTKWWVSSTSRRDQGDGSCEVLYLTRVRVDEEVFE